MAVRDLESCIETFVREKVNRDLTKLLADLQDVTYRTAATGSLSKVWEGRFDHRGTWDKSPFEVDLFVGSYPKSVMDSCFFAPSSLQPKLFFSYLSGLCLEVN